MGEKKKEVIISNTLPADYIARLIFQQLGNACYSSQNNENHLQPHGLNKVE